MRQRENSIKRGHPLPVILDVPWYTWGVTKYGHPKHPLNVSYDREMKWFPVQDYIWSFE